MVKQLLFNKCVFTTDVVLQNAVAFFKLFLFMSAAICSSHIHKSSVLIYEYQHNKTKQLLGDKEREIYTA